MKRATTGRGGGPTQAGRPARHWGVAPGARHRATASRPRGEEASSERSGRALRPPGQRSPPPSSAAAVAEDAVAIAAAAAAADRAAGRGLRRPGDAEATRRSAPPAVQ